MMLLPLIYTALIVAIGAVFSLIYGEVKDELVSTYIGIGLNIISLILLLILISYDKF